METKARPNDEQQDYNTSVTIDQTKILHARKGLRMYGGNDKSLAEIAAEVKKTVVGQERSSRLAVHVRRRGMRTLAYHP